MRSERFREACRFRGCDLEANFNFAFYFSFDQREMLTSFA